MSDAVVFKKPKGRRPAGLRQKTPPPAVEEDAPGPSAVAPRKEKQSSNPLLTHSSGSKRARDSEAEMGGRVDVNWKGTGAAASQNKNYATLSADWDLEVGDDGRPLEKRQKLKEGDEIDPEKLEDGYYHGLANYASHIKKPADGGGMSAKFRAGPVRAPANVRAITIVDYQPDVCKDYKETGFCGFGDTCKFLHDRGDYMSGWQLDNAWEKAQKAKSGGGGNGDDSDSDDEELPFACLITRKPFVDPVVTRCGHYFEKSAALKRFQKTPKCYACGASTGGIFNRATKVIEKMKEREEEARKAGEGAGSDAEGGGGIEGLTDVGDEEEEGNE